MKSFREHFLQEDSKSDKLFRQTAVSVYNRIVSKLKNLKEPLGIEDLGSDISGAGFNLGDFLNIQKYDDIFVYFAKEDPRVDAYFNKKDGQYILVLFILDRYPVSYKEYLNKEIIKKLQNNEVKRFFVHEFIHYQDSLRNKKGVLKNTISLAKKSFGDYYSSPEEYNAHYQEMIIFLDKYFKDKFISNIKTSTREESLNILKEIDFYIESSQANIINHLLKIISDSEEYDLFLDNINDITRKKLLSRLYLHLNDVIKPKLKLVKKNIENRLNK